MIQLGGKSKPTHIDYLTTKEAIVLLDMLHIHKV